MLAAPFTPALVECQSELVRDTAENSVLEQVFGRNGLAEIARRTGLSEGDASSGLSQLLPEVVDRVTPEGRGSTLCDVIRRAVIHPS